MTIKIFLATTLTLVAAFSVFAQSFISLEIFAPTNEEFSLEAPKSLALTRSIGNDANALRLYKTFAGGAYFFVVSDKNQGSALHAFPALRLGEKTADAADVRIGELQGRKFSFADEEGFYQQILIVDGKARDYVFHTVSETKDNPAVEKFFSSLRFDEAIPEIEKPAVEEKKPSAVEKQKSESGNGYGIGGASGGVGNGSNRIAPPASDKMTTALKILSKLPARYTDLARFYEITGNVPVRVTFLASGKIGSVAPTARLPFGLTTNAVAAAREILFEPAQKEGVAYSVAKIVIYSFVLY